MKRKVDPYWAEQFGVSPEPREIEQWRCGCDRCGYRVDFWARDQAEEAARMHDAKEHGGQPWATVYVSSLLAQLSDNSKDSAY
jgi:hypothetical protein